MIDGRLNLDHHTRDCLDTRSNHLISIEQLKTHCCQLWLACKWNKSNLRVWRCWNVVFVTLLLGDGCIHFLRGAPWWVTWCLLRYHLFFTFFWQISHWSSFPTVCIFKMCWNTTLNNAYPWRVTKEKCTSWEYNCNCTCLRLNLLLNILWQYWHIRGCLDFQEGPSRAAIWSGPSRAAIWSAALVPSTLWEAQRGCLVCLESFIIIRDIM